MQAPAPKQTLKGTFSGTNPRNLPVPKIALHILVATAKFVLKNQVELCIPKNISQNVPVTNISASSAASKKKKKHKELEILFCSVLINKLLLQV